jgi:type VI secretion system protein VasI
MWRPFFFFLIFPALVSGIANAQTDTLAKEIAKCAAIQGDLERLECYDQLARNLGLVETSETEPAAGNGGWIVNTKTNPVDHSRTVTLILTAEEGKSRWGTSIILVLRCASNETELYINWLDYLGSEASVLTRVDREKAKTQRWNLSTDSKATFYPRNSIIFIKRLISAKQLVAQVTPYGESPVTAVFNLAGLSNAIKPLQETCGWQ